MLWSRSRISTLLKWCTNRRRPRTQSDLDRIIANVRPQATAAPAIAKPTTTTIKPKTAAPRQTPRQSLARPESRSSQTQTSRRPAGPVDSSFLERMMRPTAASSSKTHKVEAKAPKQLSHRPRTNGHRKGPETASKAAVADHAGNTTAIEDDSEHLEEVCWK